MICCSAVKSNLAIQWWTEAAVQSYGYPMIFPIWEPWAMELQSEFPNHIKKSWLFSFWWLIDDYWFWKHLHKKNWLWLLILVMFSWFSSISTRIHTRNQDVRRSTISTLSRPGARSGLRQFAGRSLGGMGIALWSLNVAMENHHSKMVPSGKLT